MPSPWRWIVKSQRYHNTVTGQFLSAKKMIGSRDRFIQGQNERVNKLAKKLANGDITVSGWLIEFRGVIKTTYIDEYVMAHGGRHTMLPADWGRVGSMIKPQYQFADDFAMAMSQGMTEAQIAARSRMYIDGGTEAFEWGRSQALGVPKLTQYPGDGQTICRSNCKCNLRYDEQAEEWHVYWELNPAEHCESCLLLNETWSPLVVRKNG